MTVLGGLWTYFFDPQLGPTRRANAQRWFRSLPALGRRLVDRSTVARQRPEPSMATETPGDPDRVTYTYADLGDPTAAGPFTSSVR